MSYSGYTCPRCGDTFGIAGESTGSDEDIAAESHYGEQVEWHESGQCSPLTATVDSRRTEYIDGLRALADALEADPDLVLPHHGADAEYGRLSVFTHTKEQLQAWARVLPGKKDKEVDEDDPHFGFHLLGNLHGLHMLVFADRGEVCTRRVVGSREVTKQVATSFETITETEDVVEWDCGPLLSEAAS